MLVAFSVAPTTTSDPDGSVSEAVAEAIRIVRESGLPNRTDAMFTTLEGEWDECMDVVKRACAAVEAVSPRVSLVLKADIRPGYTGQLDAKVERVEQHLAPSYDIRPLVAADADELAALHIKIWRDTYTGLMPQEKLDGLDAGRSAEKWRAWLESENPPRVIGGIDKATGRIAGWITVGEPRDDDAPAPVELWVLNVDKAHQGTGLARELMQRELPDGPAYLWVVKGNARAQAFYRKFGFELDGVGKDDESGSYDLRMVRA